MLCDHSKKKIKRDRKSSGERNLQKKLQEKTKKMLKQNCGNEKKKIIRNMTILRMNYKGKPTFQKKNENNR